MKYFRLVFLALWLAACSGVGPATQTPQNRDGTASPGAVGPNATFLPTALLKTEVPTLAVTPTSSVSTMLHLWLPPELDPLGGTPAGKVLKARLTEFLNRQPGVGIDIRIKTANNNPGGMYNSLATASAAAPAALPDLVALPYEMLHPLALKGLLRPLEGLTDVMNDADWYGYARQLAFVQNSIYGLPFAGDVMVLAYRPMTIKTPPADWPALLKNTSPLAFAAADPKALCTLALYQGRGGAIQDGEGRASLQIEPLTQVLTFYQEAGKANLLPDWLTQVMDDQQVWEAFRANRADLMVTWFSRYLANGQADIAVAALPIADGAAFTLATGWVWALATPDPESQVLSIRLAEFLTDSSFLADFTEALGYLPPRPSSLVSWSNPTQRALIGPVALSARLYPPPEILTNLGNILKEATLQIINKQADPESAARQAVQKLSATP